MEYHTIYQTEIQKSLIHFNDLITRAQEFYRSTRWAKAMQNVLKLELVNLNLCVACVSQTKFLNLRFFAQNSDHKTITSESENIRINTWPVLLSISTSSYNTQLPEVSVKISFLFLPFHYPSNRDTKNPQVQQFGSKKNNATTKKINDDLIFHTYSIKKRYYSQHVICMMLSKRFFFI